MFSEGYVMAVTPTSLMVMLIVVDFQPAELFAQIVNTSPETTTDGVPQIVPLLVSKVKPEGNDALIAHEVTLPVVPLVVIDGVAEVMTVPFVPEMSL
jgi:hypothetical protein